MCGIFGAKTKKNVVPALIRGLHALEYRGYDSAGVAVITDKGLVCVRHEGKVAELEKELQRREKPLSGTTGIAHTRWATHGKPSEMNSHPHASNATIAVVHNGIIENHEDMRKALVAKGYVFMSETDTEVIPHAIHDHLKDHGDLLRAVQETVAELHGGAYAIAVVSAKHPDRIVVVRSGSPLVVGIGEGDREGDFFVASDPMAFSKLTETFQALEEGDVADIHQDRVSIYDKDGKPVLRPTRKIETLVSTADKGNYRHYMQKEIYEQPDAIRATLLGRIKDAEIVEKAFGDNAAKVFDAVHSVHIIACGTSYHSGLVAGYWFESLVKIPCRVEVASEFRYREPVLQEDTLYVFISQSGETADTLACEREVRRRLPSAHTLVVCNVRESSLVRESKLALMTNAGAEISVASTKAFTTQMTGLMLLVLALGRRNGMKPQIIAHILKELEQVPAKIEEALLLDADIRALAGEFSNKRHTLFMGRGLQYPIALEGAIKLKEISYIHAEGYPGGELKHGPLALVDTEMPVIVLVPNDTLLEKNKSNMSEVRARGGKLFVFAGREVVMPFGEEDHVMRLPEVESILAPIVYTVPLQLLAYHVALLKGTDVDQPRNLAKSVTVE